MAFKKTPMYCTLCLTLYAFTWADDSMTRSSSDINKNAYVIATNTVLQGNGNKKPGTLTDFQRGFSTDEMGSGLVQQDSGQGQNQMTARGGWVEDGQDYRPYTACSYTQPIGQLIPLSASVAASETLRQRLETRGSAMRPNQLLSNTATASPRGVNKPSVASSELQPIPKNAWQHLETFSRVNEALGLCTSAKQEDHDLTSCSQTTQV